jgi:hypothetical protein
VAVGGPDPWIVVDNAGVVVGVHDHDDRAIEHIASLAGKRRCGAVRVTPRHSQYERFARRETGFRLEGYGPEPDPAV